MFFVLDGLEQHLYFFENEKVEYAVCFPCIGRFPVFGVHETFFSSGENLPLIANSYA